MESVGSVGPLMIAWLSMLRVHRATFLVDLQSYRVCKGRYASKKACQEDRWCCAAC